MNPMGGWRALSFDSVRYGNLGTTLLREGLEWSGCAHVTATGSLEEAIRRTGARALSIATMLDAIVMSGLSPERRLGLDQFPSVTDENGVYDEGYEGHLRDWTGKVAGRRIWMAVEMQASMREFIEASTCPPRLVDVIRRTRRDLLASVQQMVANGVRPELLTCIEPVAQAARDTWIDLERTHPDVTVMRDDIWMDPEEFRSGSSERAKDLRRRIDEVLARSFGRLEGTRTILHHGFYFYTPPQWALFQLLRAMPDVDQVFIVHDDGLSQVYESWRWFFTTNWDMPEPEHQPPVDDMNAGATAFIGALHGQYVDREVLHSDIELLEFKNPARFVNHWLDYRDSRSTPTGDEEEGVPPRVFAADAEGLRRLTERLGGMEQGGSVDLTLLPIGAYLHGLHRCIRMSPRRDVRIEIDIETLVDIVSSGYLASVDGEPINPAAVNILRRVAPFFGDRALSSEWRTRAESLHRMIVDDVMRWGGRTPAETDVGRMSSVARNPLRLAPWVDVTPDEAGTVVKIIEAVEKFATEVAAEETRNLRDHVDYVKDHVLRRLSNLNEDTRRTVESIMEGMTVAVRTTLVVDDLIQLVNLLLSESANFGPPPKRGRWKIEELGFLDALGFERHAGAVQVANLSDATYPAVVRTVSWPFSLDDLRRSPDSIAPVALEIMETREKTSNASGLYLLSLALDGAVSPNTVTLSYMKSDGRETFNPSPVLTLLAEPQYKATDAVRQRLGGLPLEVVEPGELEHSLRTQRLPKPPRASDDLVDTAMGRLPLVATASAVACPRRFALQWAAGPSPAYQAEHHQQILFGNLLRRFGSVPQLVVNLFRHITKGQRDSSEKKAVLRVVRTRTHEGYPGARAEWLFTLEGDQDRTDPLARAYQVAIADSGEHPPSGLVAPNDQVFLPVAHTDTRNDVCKACPVRSRCAVWTEPEDR